MSDAGEILKGLGEIASGAAKNSDGTASEVLGFVGLGAQVIGRLVDLGVDPHEAIPLLLPRLIDIVGPIEGQRATRAFRVKQHLSEMDTEPAGPPSGASGDPGDEHR